MSSTPNPRHSKTFNEGYGDFTIESGDGVLFHVSSFLLGYISPIFKDMFDLGSERSGSKVKVTEDSVTLDILFRHIDPKQTPLPLEGATVAGLLEAGRKYQLPAIMTWFETEAATSKITGNPPNTTSKDSLLLRDPTLVLSLAINYGIKSLIGPAIALRVGQGPLEERDRGYGFDVYHQISLLRQKRIQIFTEIIRQICDMATVRLSKKGSHTADTQLVCPACGYQRHEWVMDMVESVQRSPRWDVFYATFCGRSKNCSDTYSPCRNWVSEASEFVDAAKTTVAEAESEIPEL